MASVKLGAEFVIIKKIHWKKFRNKPVIYGKLFWKLIAHFLLPSAI